MTGGGGLYNVLFGRQPDAGLLLMLLNVVHKTDPGRIRDGWVEIEGDWYSWRIHTRNGGGNREWQAKAIESMRSHPWYSRDEDMAFDTTYADFWFTPPRDWAEQVCAVMNDGDDQDVDPEALRLRIESQAVRPVDMSERWREAIAALDKPRPKHG